MFVIDSCITLYNMFVFNNRLSDRNQIYSIKSTIAGTPSYREQIIFKQLLVQKITETFE